VSQCMGGKITYILEQPCYMAWVLTGHARLALSGVQQQLQDTAHDTLQRP
jgi:hypothetical protein